MQWKEIRPYVKHTEGYAVLPEQYCKKAFKWLMERLRAARPIIRRRVFKPFTIFLKNGYDSKFVRRVKLRNMPKHIKKTWRSRNPTARAQKTRKEKIQATKLPLTAEETAKQQVAKQKKTKAEREAKRKVKAQARKERKARVAKIRIQNKKKRKALLS